MTEASILEASRLWREMRSTFDIAEAVGVSRESILHLSQARRDLFPRRTPEQRKLLISKGRLS